MGIDTRHLAQEQVIDRPPAPGAHRSSDDVMASNALQPTATEDELPRRFTDFATLGEALDYAATGARGLNFHDARGTLARAYPFVEMRADAI